MRNQQHFGQAYIEKTPFTEEPLRTRFSWNGESHEALMVLEGKCTKKDFSEIERMFPDHLVRVKKI